MSRIRAWRRPQLLWAAAPLSFIALLPLVLAAGSRASPDRPAPKAVQHVLLLSVDGLHVHLANRADAQLIAVSRAPLEKLQAYKRRMGWTFAWASSFGTDFNYDYAASATLEQLHGGGEYNFAPTGDRTQVFELDSGPLYETAKGTGASLPEFLQERPGMSAFALSDGAVYHTYSAYARGLDGLWGAYQWLDRAPLGRNSDDHIWVRHDEYELARA